MKCIKPILFMILLLSLYVPTSASDYLLKAEFIERFTRFIEWPSDLTPSNNSNSFIMTVIGPNPFGPHLNDIAETRKIKNKRFEIKEISNIDELDFCHILFITHSEEKNLIDILTRTRNKPILTIGDTRGFAKKGVLINFYRAGKYMRFEINLLSVERSGLKFSSKFLKLAKIIYSE